MKTELATLPFLFPETKQEIRVLKNTQDNSLWFVAKDIGEVLGISNIRPILSSLKESNRIQDKDLAEVSLTYGRSGSKNVTILSEPAMYTLVLRSDKPEAIKFQHWVTQEVLPKIRETGTYKHEPSIFVKRAFLNENRVEKGYFSVLSELYKYLHMKLEFQGYTPKNYGENNQEIRPDISVGKLFPKWLEEHFPKKACLYKEYLQILPENKYGKCLEISCRSYSIDVLPLFLKFMNEEWMPNRASEYFKKRDILALDYVQKFLE